MSNVDARLSQSVTGRFFLQQQIFQALGRPRAAAEPAPPAEAGVDSAWSTIAGALRESLGDTIGAVPQSASRYAVHDLAQALRTALAAPGADGQQRAATLLERLNAGFDAARKRLEEAGFDAKSIDTAIATFRERLADLIDAYARGVDRPSPAPAVDGAVPPPATDPAPPADATAVPLAATATRATYVRKETMRLEVLTQEGDVVSLKIRNRDAMQATSGAAVWADAAAVRASVDVVTTSKVRIQVQGDLNDDELAAIQDLATQAGAIADRFFSGDVAAAFEAGAALDVDASQIAAAGLKLAVRERFTLQQAATVAPPSQAAAAPAPAEPPVTPPVTPPSVAPPPAPTAAAAADPAPAITAPAVPASRDALTASLGAQIASLLSWAQSASDAGRLEIRMQFKLRLVATLVDLGAPQDATAGDALRRRTLQQLTAPATTAAA